MHKNYRRKQGRHNPKKAGRGNLGRPYSLAEDRQLYWQAVRANERRLMAHERYDELKIKHRPSILWNWS